MKKIWYLMSLLLLVVVLVPAKAGAIKDACLAQDEECYDVCVTADDVCEQEVVLENSGLLTKYMKVTSPDILSNPIGKNSISGETQHVITWTSPTVVKKVNLLYSIDGGKNYIEIAAGIENTGSYEWTLPAVNTDYALVRVSGFGADGHNYGSDLSNAFFTINNA